MLIPYGNKLSNADNKELAFHNFNKINLPVSMDPEDLGEIRSKSLLNKDTIYFVYSEINKRIYEIIVSSDKLINKVTILGAFNLSPWGGGGY